MLLVATWNCSLSYKNGYAELLLLPLLPLLNHCFIVEIYDCLIVEVFSIGINLVGVQMNYLNWLHFLILEGGLLLILIDCMIFLPPFLDVTRVSMSIVFFPRTARLWNFLPIEFFSLTYDLSGLKYRIRFFLNRFPVYFNLFVLLFLVTPCLVVAVEPCIKGILINKKRLLCWETFWDISDSDSMS